MKAVVLSLLEILFIAVCITVEVAMVTSVFILRVAVGSEYPRRPAEGLVLGIILVMVAVKMTFATG